MESIKLWARNGAAVRQAIELGELAHIETTPRTRLAWDETVPHHIAAGALAVRIRSRASEATVQQLAEEARDHCPICNLFGATATVTLAVSVIAD